MCSHGFNICHYMYRDDVALKCNKLDYHKNIKLLNAYYLEIQENMIFTIVIIF